MEPCGTSYSIFKSEELELLIFTYYFLFYRIEQTIYEVYILCHNGRVLKGL